MSYNRKAIATETTCASLFTLAEEWGEAVIWLPSEHQCVLLRNRLYKHRQRVRKNAGKVTGVEASPYDGMTFSYAAEQGPDLEDTWKFIVAFDVPMVLKIEIPDWVKPEDLPAFDVPEADFEVYPVLGSLFCPTCGEERNERCDRIDCDFLPF